MSDLQGFRNRALGGLTNEIGVYALCDLDERPIYVGQSVDGIRTRVRRHLTSARSDVIANRQIDVWEIAFVWAWPCATREAVGRLEEEIFSIHDAELPLMNGRVIAVEGADPSLWPDRQSVQVMPDDEIATRRDPRIRLPRQIRQYELLVDYILTVKSAPHLRRSLEAHFRRMVKYHRDFMWSGAPVGDLFERDGGA